MKTLQIGESWPEQRMTGLTRYFLELSRYLALTGTEVRSLVIGARGLRATTGGVVTAFAAGDEPLWKRMLLVRQAAEQQILENKIDLVASHFALYAAPLSSKAKRVPMVVHFHGPWAAESDVEGSTAQRSRLKYFIERTVYRRGRRFIVLSKAFQQVLVSEYGVDERLVHVIPGGIDVERFSPKISREAARQRMGWPDGRPVLLSVRRQVRRMGLENLIDAMREIRLTSPDALLLLGGSGPLAGELQHRIREKGLEHNVQLLGRISEDDLPLAYRAADMTVVPSQALEGFGLITLESLACGTPVLTTPVGGLPEVIQPLAPECVFADASTAAMAATLGEVLRGSQLLPSEQACRRYAVQNFDWVGIARRVRSVYNEALS